MQGGVPLGLYVAWEASPKANYSLQPNSCTSERTVRISTLLFIRMVSVREQHVARFFYWANEPEKIEARGTRIRHAAPSQVEITPFIDWPREDKDKKKKNPEFVEWHEWHTYVAPLLKAPSVLWLERRPIDRQRCSPFSLTNQARAFKDRRKTTRRLFCFRMDFPLPLFLALSWEVYLASTSTPYLLNRQLRILAIPLALRRCQLNGSHSLSGSQIPVLFDPLKHRAYIINLCSHIQWQKWQ